MNEKEILDTIRKTFDDDVKRDIRPVSTIKDFCPKETLSDIKELLVSAGFFAYRKAREEGIRDTLKALRICNYDVSYTPDEIEKILKTKQREKTKE